MGLFSFFSNKGKSEDKTKKGEAVEYNGYTITPAPRTHEGQYLTAGIISKEFSEGLREQHFIRADFFTSWDDACAQAVVKGKRIIEEQGDKLFSDLS